MWVDIFSWRFGPIYCVPPKIATMVIGYDTSACAAAGSLFKTCFFLQRYDGAPRRPEYTTPTGSLWSWPDLPGSIPIPLHDLNKKLHEKRINECSMYVGSMYACIHVSMYVLTYCIPVCIMYACRVCIYNEHGYSHPPPPGRSFLREDWLTCWWWRTLSTAYSSLIVRISRIFTTRYVTPCSRYF